MPTILKGNIHHALPDASAAEALEELARLRGGPARVERIVSEGQASPEGFWYDQDWDEWVLLLAGEAELEFADPAGSERLSPGDWLLIPARRRHRVQSTAKGTLWLAVHGGRV